VFRFFFFGKEPTLQSTNYWSDSARKRDVIEGIKVAKAFIRRSREVQLERLLSL
jgi:hypothetical protein